MKTIWPKFRDSDQTAKGLSPRGLGVRWLDTAFLTADADQLTCEGGTQTRPHSKTLARPIKACRLPKRCVDTNP